MLYSNSKYYLLRKPHGIASTFGKEQSILDYFKEPKELETIIKKSDFNQYSSYCYLDGYVLEHDISLFINNQTTKFTKDQEYGLLNRLDNDTGGFLYFAKNSQSFGLYKEQQNSGNIQKMYLAQVYGNPFFKTNDSNIIIDKPIMHHAFDDQKMIVIINQKDETNGRGKQHKASTKIELIKYDKETNLSLIRIMIHKGVRHQIRVHCKSIGAPIVGDSLYGPKPLISDFLHLRSIGMK